MNKRFGLVASSALFLAALCHGAAREELSLAGSWQFALDEKAVGFAEKWESREFSDAIDLPGTTDIAGKGGGKIGGHVVERVHPQLVGSDVAKQMTARPTRRHPYVGVAWYRREVEFPATWGNRRVTLNFERTKILTLFVDGERIGTMHSLSTDQVFELPDRFAVGRHVVTLAVDNRIDTLPVSGHQVSDDTQTNWNGIIGEMKAVASDKVAIGGVKVFPHVADRTADVEVRIVNRLCEAVAGTVTVVGGAQRGVARFADARSGSVVRLRVPFAPETPLWDEFSPSLQTIGVSLDSGACHDETSVRFGFCEFRTRGSQFAVNGKPTFLRGRHDACVWPKTGCPPMDKASWIGYFRKLQEWGLNHVRAHSWCFPRAAFEAADETGFYLQPEFARFGGKFSTDEMQRLYALAEARRISDAYGNSPSFVMWTFANEPIGHEQPLSEMVAEIRDYDPRRLYAQASNGDYQSPHQHAGDDFWVTFRSCPGRVGNVRGSYAHCDLPLGGVQLGAAGTFGDFSAAVPHSTVPIVGHEVGQYESYPDFREIDKYDGVLRALNFEIFRDRLDKAGMLDLADDFFRASAALQAINYREDVEEALRTPNFGGFQLLDLQDFPGQGTALVGLLNAFMEPKGAVAAERWRDWCAPTVLLARFASYTHNEGDSFSAKVQCAHYGIPDVIEDVVEWRLAGPDGVSLATGSVPLKVRRGEVASADGDIAFDFPSLGRAAKLSLEMKFRNRPVKNAYALWSYPRRTADDMSRKGVAEVRDLEEARRLAAAGRRVLCVLNKTAFPANAAIEGFFATDFWNYAMFRHVCDSLKMKPAPGTLGLLVDEKHPALSEFPTSFHSDYQWRELILNGVNVVLDGDDRASMIVQGIDNVARNHRLGVIWEERSGGGLLVVSGIDLDAVSSLPEGRQLRHSLLSYLAAH